MKTVSVALAFLFDRKGSVLIAQRPAHKTYGGLWEFPGVKLEIGESPEAAIVRELREELCITVRPRTTLSPYLFDIDCAAQLQFFPVLCDWDQQELTLVEHEDVKFVELGNLKSMSLAPPDFQAADMLFSLQS